MGMNQLPTSTGDSDFLEDHPMTCKWLKTMVIVSPLFLGLWDDPFQMAFLWLVKGVILTTYYMG